MPPEQQSYSMLELLNLLKEWAGVIFPVLAALFAVAIWLFNPIRAWLGKLLSGRIRRVSLLDRATEQTRLRIDRYCSDHAPGSTRFKQGSGLKNVDFLGCLDLWSRASKAMLEPSELKASLFAKEQSSIPSVIIGERGAGKSFITYWLAMQALDQSKSRRIAPLLLTMPEVIRIIESGHARLFGSEKDWKIDDIVKLVEESKLVLLIDAADEALQRANLDNIRQVAEHRLFRSAKIVTCRTSYYESTFRYAVPERDVIEVQLSPDGRLQLVELVAPFYFGGMPEAYQACASAKRLASQLTLGPLDIHVLLELTPCLDNNDEVSSLFDLYQRFAKARLELAAMHKATTLTPAEAMQFHMHLACAAQSDGNRIDIEAGIVSGTSVHAILLDFGAISRNLTQAQATAEISHFGFVVEHNYGSVQAIAYRHWRFLDYFLAESLWASVVSEYKNGSRVWRSFIHQELGLMLKSLLLNSNSSQSLIESIVSGFLRLINLELQTMALSPWNSTEWRVSRGAAAQLFYYASHLRSARLLNFVNEKLDAGELDSYLQRSTVIGLAFGGQTNRLDQFVQSLIEEESAGGSKLNSENVGHQLSYFGDQAFDFLDPHRIETPGRCGETIKKLLAQLNSQALRPSWRIDAFTICYLARHAVWQQAARSVLARERRALSSAVRCVIDNGYGQDWPELDRLLWLNREFNGD